MISFFFEPYSFAKRDGHLLRGSSIIRGQQIGEYLGAKLNPKEGYENDVCIHVKPYLNEDFIPKGKPYIDLVDEYSWNMIFWLQDHPDISIIFSSKESFDYLPNRHNLKNKVYLIPQHHCNYERAHRTRKEITNVGFIGCPRSFWHPYEDFSKKLEKIGMKFLVYERFKNRQHVVDFYKKIDIQVSWVPKYHAMKNPLKIVNAASFGIPTVCYPLRTFDEVDGYYTPAKTIDEMVEKINGLKNGWESQRLIDMAEKYHIEHIAQLYRNL